MSSESDTDAKRAAAGRYIDPVLREMTGDLTDLSQALQTYHNLSLWVAPSGGVSVLQAVQVWALVESVRRSGFPKELRV